MRNEKFSYLIRIIAGAYLFYLAVKLIQGITEGEMLGGNMVLGVCASILFLGAGAYFVLASIRGLLKMMRGDNDQKIEDEAMMEEVLEEKEEAVNAEAEKEGAEEETETAEGTEEETETAEAAEEEAEAAEAGTVEEETEKTETAETEEASAPDKSKKEE